MITIANSNIAKISVAAAKIHERVNLLTGMLIFSGECESIVLDNEIEYINKLLAQLPREIAVISQANPPASD